MLKLLAREIDDLRRSLPPDKQDGLEAVLQHRLGVDLKNESAARADRAWRIARRGHFLSEKVRQFAAEFVDEFFEHSEFRNLVNSLQVLLAES